MTAAKIAVASPYAEERGLIIYTDERCVIKGIPRPGIPTLVWRDGIDAMVSDYIRFLFLQGDTSEGSICEYIKTLRPFARYIRLRGIPTKDIGDEVLEAWRDDRLACGVSKKRINTSLHRIFDMLARLERTKQIRYVVGCYDGSDLPDRLRGHKFPVTAVRVFTKGRSGQVHTRWRTIVAFTSVGGESGNRHTPDEKETRRIHGVALSNRHALRDTCMMSWAEETGARRNEFLQLRVSLLPSLEDLVDTSLDRTWPIPVVRKGGKRDFLYPTEDLLIRTHDYIEFDRRQVLDTRSNDPAFVEPDDLFLSGRTGLSLTGDAVTYIIGKAFKKAGVANASVHRFRARYLANALDSLLDAIFVQDDIPNIGSWTETILTKLTELAGHASPLSLRPYLTHAFQKRLKATATARAADAERRVRNAETQSIALERRLASVRSLAQIADAVQRDDFDAALKLCAEMHKRISRLARNHRGVDRSPV